MDPDQTGPAEPVRAAILAATQGVAMLAREATEGRVVLDPEAGERLLGALRAQIDHASDWIERADRLSRAVPLGRNPVGTAMAGKFERRANGDQVSLSVALAHYRAVLTATLTAVDTAIRGYQDVDDTTAARFRRLAGPDQEAR